MKVKPARGLKVRDPVIKDYLPEEGREVGDFDFYWIRRLRDKDVIRVIESTIITAQEAAE